jgi:hypothetical protein
MGMTQDPRFLPVLTKLVRDTDSSVRSNALRAGNAIRAHLNVLKRDPVKVYVTRATILDSGVRTASLSLRHAGGSAIPALHALAFTLEEDGQPVTRFDVTPVAQEGSVCTGLIAPAESEIANEFREALRAAFQAALEQKPHSELWATACFTHADGPGADGTAFLQSTVEQVQRGYELAGKSPISGMLPAIEATCSSLPAGERTLIVIGNEAAESTTIVFHRDRHMDAVLPALRNQGIVIHGVLLPGCTPLFASALRTFARETGGEMHEVHTGAELQTKVTALLSSAHCEYKVRYWGFENAAAPGRLHASVKTATGFGDASASIAPCSG